MTMQESPDKNQDEMDQWIGRSQSAKGVITPDPVRAMAATLNQDCPDLAPGTPLPRGWHWLYFHSIAKTQDLGPDGHAQRGEFLPPITLPRRMWAGGRFTFHAPLTLGAQITQRSTIENIAFKQGRSGALAFVTVRHELTNEAGELCVTDEQDIVYREGHKNAEKSGAAGGSSAPGSPTPAPQGAMWDMTIQPDPVLLFRFSALTFNGHRIHYDRDYCRDQEGYPGLVFHGPLTALLLLGFMEHNCAPDALKKMSYRGVAPLFDLDAFQIEGKREGGHVSAWAKTPEGHLAMQAEAEIDC